MKAVILAGGKGERLRPLTNKIPKPMVKVGGKPILEHIIKLLKRYEISDLIIALAYLPESISSYFGDGSKFGVNITYTFEDNPLGTAGAVSLARDDLKSTFMVTYGDILRKLNILEMLKIHQKYKALATINVYKRSGQDPKSMVVFDKKGKVIKFIERPKPQDLKGDFVWVNGAFYIFEPEIFDIITEGKPLDFGKDIFPKLLSAKKKVYAFPSSDYFVDIGDLKKLQLARKTFKAA